MTSDALRSRITRRFELFLALLTANGFLSVFGTDVIDPFTSLLVVVALGARLLRAYGRLDFQVDRRLASALALAFVLFYPIDIRYVSGDFISATVRLLFLFTALKLAIADKPREWFYLGVLAFLHLLTASMFTAGPGFLFTLVAFLALASATYAAYDLRRGCESGVKVVIGAERFRLGTRLFALGLVMAVSILLMSTILFLVLPRPFGGGFQGAVRTGHSVGFSTRVDLGLTGSLAQDTTPVMRVESLDGARLQGLRWRGLALHRFDGVSWSAPNVETRAVSSSAGEYALRRGHERRVDDGVRLNFRAHLEPIANGALFVAGVPEEVSGAFTGLLIDDHDSLLLPDRPDHAVRYQAATWLVDRERLRPSPVVELFSERFKQRYLRLPAIDPRIAELTHDLVAGEAAPLRRAARIETYLRNSFGYTLELPKRRVEDPLAHFLFVRREGHCEYFASSMAVMLRTLGVPSRLVNGFAGGVENPLTGMQVLRSSDAHTWVEAYIPGYGWLEFDPTPPAPASTMDSLTAALWLYRDAAQSAWAKWVVNFDAERQARLAREMQRRSRDAALDAYATYEAVAAEIRDALRTAASAVLNPNPRWGSILAAVVFSLVGLTWAAPRASAWLRRRRIRRGAGRGEDAAYFYDRALRRLRRRGYPRGPAQTAEEFVETIGDSRLRALCRRITAAYNAARYGGDAESERRLPDLVRDLERLKV